VAQAGYRLFTEQFTTSAIGVQAKESLEGLLQGR